jgi:hypothetical protein
VRLRNGPPNVLVPGIMSFEIESCRKDSFMWHHLVDEIRSLEPNTSGVVQIHRRIVSMLPAMLTLRFLTQPRSLCPYLDNTKLDAGRQTSHFVIGSEILRSLAMACVLQLQESTGGIQSSDHPCEHRHNPSGLNSPSRPILELLTQPSFHRRGEKLV